MQYTKISRIFLIATAALMALGATASATTLTSPTGTSLWTGTTIKLESEGEVKVDGTIVIACQQASGEGYITNASAVSGTVSEITGSECGTSTVSILNEGHGGTATINSSSEVFSTGAELTTLTHNILGTVHCIYKTNNTKVGTLTDSHDTGSNATLDMGSAGIPEVATDTFACKDDAVLTGNFKVATPWSLYVD